jgi:hypothetical protein
LPETAAPVLNALSCCRQTCTVLRPVRFPTRVGCPSTRWGGDLTAARPHRLDFQRAVPDPERTMAHLLDHVPQFGRDVRVALQADRTDRSALFQHGVHHLCGSGRSMPLTRADPDAENRYGWFTGERTRRGGSGGGCPRSPIHVVVDAAGCSGD